MTVVLLVYVGEASPKRTEKLLFDDDTRTVCVDGNNVSLTNIEYRLAKALMSNPGKTMTKRELVAKAYGDSYMATNNALAQRIHALKNKIGKSHIECVSGYGYRFV